MLTLTANYKYIFLPLRPKSRLIRQIFYKEHNNNYLDRLKFVHLSNETHANGELPGTEIS